MLKYQQNAVRQNLSDLGSIFQNQSLSPVIFETWNKVLWEHHPYQIANQKIKVLIQFNLLIYLKIAETATGGVLYKKDVLRNFTKFTGKHLCQCLFFNKVAGRDLQPY